MEQATAIPRKKNAKLRQKTRSVRSPSKPKNGEDLLGLHATTALLAGDFAEIKAQRALAELRSRQILAGLMAFRDGDFSVRLPVDWAATDGRIAEAFNEAIGREERITAEAARLSATVGKEGRLSQRMAVPGATGGWADKVDSLNTLIDDLVRPTIDIARTIGAVAKGDLDQLLSLMRVWLFR